MTDAMDPADVRKLMEEQLGLSRRLRDRVRELEEARHAPLAVVGMGLRLPGDLKSPEEYWDFLCGDADALSGIPEDRPGLRTVYDPAPGRPGRSYVDRAGFLGDIAGFDAEFFGISQREAKLLDPQQRLLLEVSWEALERAGIAVNRADRLDVGVYLGMMASEYNERLKDRGDTSRIDPYFTTGGGLCFGAGRISYVMGFSGPVVSVDTACSSSLAALHLAVRGLRGDECRYALVCGSNLLLSADLMVSLSQARALSPEGRSKSFLASADGYGRGEGVGALVLMRLADAEREGRPVLAVVRGTAMGHDGAASGLTAPNGPAQQEVIAAALADGGVEPADLGWIEAHGTGTVLGDPIEIGALDAVVGQAVRDRGVPLALGSVKSRIGHLEAASGVASLIKTVLMLEHGEIPAAASPDDGQLNTHIAWDRMNFTVPRRNGPWPAELPRRVAGVNSFGMSGTNVHAVLEAYAPAAGPRPPRGDHPAGELLALSAKDPAALAELAAAARACLTAADATSLSSICHTLRAGRAAFDHRLAVTGADAAELTRELDAAWAAQSGPVSPLRTVVLRVSADDAALDSAVTELAGAFPALTGEGTGPASAGPDGAVGPGPVESLARMVRGLGPEVEVRVDPDAPDATAALEWPAGGGATVSTPLVGGDARNPAALLLTAAAALFTAGARLRWDRLRAPGANLLSDLPTYPFRRKRHWIEEPHDGAGAARGTDTSGRTAPAASGPHLFLGPLTPAEREAYLLAELRNVLDEPEGLDPERSFLDAGGDSFTSTLFITKVEEHFDVGLPPEELPLDVPLAEMIGKLAAHITRRDAEAEREPSA
ncbi:beta-ketoacyl synthase N-terminal-like domain-containing protein [Streptomyces sp. NBC_00893]|uniref:beta-ketoacyl synthase N-terminal-like domain-containing protein n=1 Tax=Streptomyces sp. NBC_00893 TaxID=2975862 RepID=UPI00224E714E|nr:beta-ketoacyl synthase N-terminal-like domain-containing protein [Streptomyces sp. NBC_00893]MCX4849543.1 phosphopantetheine-binding protein [Streptomyces sp. NBC_00893]